MQEPVALVASETLDGGIHGVVVGDLETGAVGKINVARSIPEPGRNTQLGIVEASVQILAADLDRTLVVEYELHLPPGRRSPVVVGGRGANHRPKSRSSASPISSPVALSRSRSLAANPSSGSDASTDRQESR